MNIVKPRVAIIGTGAIGGFYGLMLQRAGFEVHFLLRSEYQAVKEQGIRIESATLGCLQADVNAWDNAGVMPKCDWVLLGTKATANAQMAKIINQAANTNANVVLLQNGFGLEDELRASLRDDLLLFGGLCFICVHRKSAGVIEHQAYGGVNVAYHSGAASPQVGQDQAQLLVNMFNQANVDSHLIANIEQARWQKLVWNIPYNGLSVLLNAHTGQMMQNSATRQLISDMMHEVVNAAMAHGYSLPDNFVEKMLVSTDKMPDYFPSMYHDFTHQRPLELHNIYTAPLVAAQQVGCAMPKVEMLLQTLSFIAQQPA
ncbi:putative 2-dehydropantoate 2-reductase [Pseudomonas sp. F1_0610]|uniref:putative 2-dehydropantoate 2-reductase n=1 Tax=Pseudomonas sp. F1_0610 TaxID=3114284 RepID=UPI0039C488F4